MKVQFLIEIRKHKSHKFHKIKIFKCFVRFVVKSAPTLEGHQEHGGTLRRPGGDEVGHSFIRKEDLGDDFIF
jgi:hypothetical protein